MSEAGRRFEIDGEALRGIPRGSLLCVQKSVVPVADGGAVVGAAGVPMQGKVGDQAAGERLDRDAGGAAAAEDHGAAAAECG